MNSLQAETAIKALWHHLDAVRGLFDEGINELMINSPSDVWVEQHGVMIPKSDIVFEPEQIDGAIRVLANLNHKSQSTQREQSILDCRLPGLRIAAARHPVAMRGHSMCIRKHSTHQLTLGDYQKSGAFTRHNRERVQGSSEIPIEIAEKLADGENALVEFFQWVVRTGKTIAVTGSTSSGKTTLLGALLQEVPKELRLITCEDTGELSELQLQLPNLVHLEAVGVSMRELVRLCLRYRPSRIVMGEVRGPEAFDLIRAFGTGHDGGLATWHANSADDAFLALEIMVQMAPEAQNIPISVLRRMIAGTFDFVVHAANVTDVQAPRAPITLLQVLGLKDGWYEFKSLYSRFN